MTKKGLALLLLGWFCFVAIPIVNAQHPGEEQHWVRLCTSAGILLIAVEDNDSSFLDDHGTYCPCAQNLFIVIADRMPAISHGRSILNVDFDFDPATPQPFTAYRPRAPPSA